MENKKLMWPILLSILLLISMLSGCVVSGTVISVRWEHADDSATSVKLVGGYVVLDEIEDFNVGFVWDTEKHMSWKSYSSDFVPAEKLGPLNSYYTYIYGLDRTVTYHYRAVGEFIVGGKSRWYQSFDRTFTPGLPEVSTRRVEEIDENSAKLYGVLSHMGGASSCEVWFEYEEESSSGSPPNHYDSTEHQTLYDKGEFHSLVSNLESNTTYYFRAVASNDVGKDYGIRFNFTTMPEQ